MDYIDKKIVVTSAGYELPRNCTLEDLDRLFVQVANSPPNQDAPACFLKELLIEYLETIAKDASLKKRKINANAQEGYFWELKATFYLFYEAKSLVDSVPEQYSVPEFREELKSRLQKKHGDWGYGSNWSESIQRFVMESLRKELERFVGDLNEKGCC